MRGGNFRARSRRAHRRYLHAEQVPSGAAASVLSVYAQRLIPAVLLLTVTAVVLFGGGFWPAAPAVDPISGLPSQSALGNSASLVDTSGSAATSDTISVTVAVPGGTTTNALSTTATDSTFLGYLARPGANRTMIPQRVSIVPALRADTLTTIAQRMNSTPQALMWANGITDPSRLLTPGQTIRVPPPGTMLHRVKDTDTLDGIARAYQVKTQDITSYPGNNVQESSDLVPGAFLLIPSTNLPTRDHTVFYLIQEGDSLARVSGIYALANPLTLRWANNLPSDLIHPGQIIAIPPTDGVIHVVETEDTQRTTDDAVTQIAKNFACTAIPCKDPPSNAHVNALVEKIFAFGGNHLTRGGKLIMGQEVLIPGGIPYVEPPPVIIPINVTLDNPDVRTTSPTYPLSGGNQRTSGVPTSGSSAIVSVAQRYLGAYRQPNGLPWAFWCEKFVGDVADNAGVSHYRYATALADAYSGPLYHTSAPAGALVFFDASWNVAGHVGIAMGDGTMISALSTGVVRTAYAGSSGYLGWRSF